MSTRERTPAPAPVARAEGQATARRVLVDLAEVLAGAEPDPARLAEILAEGLEVTAVAVLRVDDRGSNDVVLASGFRSGDVIDLVGQERAVEAMESGRAVAIEVPAAAGTLSGARALAIAPLASAGHPWGIVVVGSQRPDAFGAPSVSRLERVATGLGVVLAPLVPEASGTLSRERRMRQGFETVVDVVSGIVEDATPAAAARSLVEALHQRLGWERILIASHRPALGLVPLAVAGRHVEIADVLSPALMADVTELLESGDSPTNRQPMFDGSASQLLVPLGVGPVGIAGVLSIESHRAEAFDDVDAELARAVAGLIGPLLARLGLRNERRALAVRVEQADRRQRRRFTSLAHELRTPITVMLGYADLLADKEPDEAQRREYAQTLARHARALGRMVDNALVAWQLDDGSLELSIAKVPTRDAVGEAAASLGMEPDVSDSAELHVRADAFWLPRVIAALLDNARRYVVDANVRVTSRADDGRVKIAVHDDGPGIASDDVLRVFDAFHRGDDGGIGPHRGVGLGLTVARALTRAMGGELEVVSATDYGTTFTIDLAEA